MARTSNLLSARLSVLAIFFVHGAVFATWVSRIPAVQASLDLSTSRLGFALLGVAVGSFLSMPVATGLIERFGSKRVTALASLGFCCALILPPLTRTSLTLGLALAVLGALAGAMDLSMNAQGVAVETAAAKPFMSSFHAAFSLGGMAGAVTGGAVAKAGVGVLPHLSAAALVFFIFVLSVSPYLLSTPPSRHRERTHRRLTPAVVGLGAICFCFFLGEGAVADWSALFLLRNVHSGPAQSTTGFALFSGAMATGRLAGDSLRARFGAVMLVRNGALLAAGGLTLALLAGNVYASLAGFAIAGFGCSIIVPIAFAATGSLPQPAGSLAGVVTMGYLGLFIGPPLIGMAAESLTLRGALFLVVILFLATVPLASMTRSSRPPQENL